MLGLRLHRSQAGKDGARQRTYGTNWLIRTSFPTFIFNVCSTSEGSSQAIGRAASGPASGYSGKPGGRQTAAGDKSQRQERPV